MVVYDIRYATSDGNPINANSNIIHGFYVDEVQKDREKLIHLVVRRRTGIDR